jgi:haloalkane dehalogenase
MEDDPMEFRRTPDERFENLPGYPFEPHYVQLAELRIHYVDEGPRRAAPVVMLHGEPSWSYLYRKMIPIVAGAGHRVVAPDLVGFGRSDKPLAREDYTYQNHVDWMRELLFDQLDLTGITLVGQDWGGLIGLRLAAEHPERFARIVAANALLPTGDENPGPAFEAWKKYSQEVPDFRAGRIVSGATATELSDAVCAAYDAPFPDESYKAGARQFPLLVPVTPDDPAAPANRAAWKVLRKWEKPFLTAFSDGDPITRPFAESFQQIPGAAGQPHVTIEGAAHFLQEDKGEALARVVNDFIARTADA